MCTSPWQLRDQSSTAGALQVLLSFEHSHCAVRLHSLDARVTGLLDHLRHPCRCKLELDSRLSPAHSHNRGKVCIHMSYPTSSTYLSLDRAQIFGPGKLIPLSPPVVFGVLVCIFLSPSPSARPLIPFRDGSSFQCLSRSPCSPATGRTTARDG